MTSGDTYKAPNAVGDGHTQQWQMIPVLGAV